MNAWSSWLQYRMISYLMSLLIFALRFGWTDFLAGGFRFRGFGLMGLSYQPIRRQHAPNLLHLIRLRLAPAGLEVQDLRHILPREDVVIAANSLGEPQMG